MKGLKWFNIKDLIFIANNLLKKRYNYSYNYDEKICTISIIISVLVACFTNMPFVKILFLYTIMYISLTSISAVIYSFYKYKRKVKQDAIKSIKLILNSKKLKYWQ